jgi:hypothetical protein
MRSACKPGWVAVSAYRARRLHCIRQRNPSGMRPVSPLETYHLAGGVFCMVIRPDSTLI